MAQRTRQAINASAKPMKKPSMTSDHWIARMTSIMVAIVAAGEGVCKYTNGLEAARLLGALMDGYENSPQCAYPCGTASDPPSARIPSEGILATPTKIAKP